MNAASQITADEAAQMPTFICVWHGPSNNRGANQYAVERSANRGTALAWCDDIRSGEYLCRLLNGGESVEDMRDSRPSNGVPRCSALLNHPDILELRLSNERIRLSLAKTENEKALRRVWIAQMEKEIRAEVEFVSAPVSLSDEELLAQLNT